MYVFGGMLLRCIKCYQMKIRFYEKNDMDIVTFVEEYLGIELLQYQKEYLKWLSNQDTKPTYWITRTPKTECSFIMEITKRCLQKN